MLRKALRPILGFFLLAAPPLTCARVNPPPNEHLLREREVTSLGRNPSEPTVGPGLPPTGPVVARQRDGGLAPESSSPTQLGR